MITLYKQFGTFYDIFKESKEIAITLNTEARFPFNGVDFVVNEYSTLPRPFEVEKHIKESQGYEVYI